MEVFAEIFELDHDRFTFGREGLFEFEAIDVVATVEKSSCDGVLAMIDGVKFSVAAHGLELRVQVVEDRVDGYGGSNVGFDAEDFVGTLLFGSDGFRWINDVGLADIFACSVVI